MGFLNLMSRSAAQTLCIRRHRCSDVFNHAIRAKKPWMCTLAIFREVSERFPLVVAANRDEFYARPSEPPATLPEDRRVVAGRDLQAGGTWLGATVSGTPHLAALLNRRIPGEEASTAPGTRSRGELCLRALVGRYTAREGLGAVVAGGVEGYGLFNLLIADRAAAYVIDNADGLRTTELPAGLSVLTNLHVNDVECARLANAVPRFEEAGKVIQKADEEREIVDCLAAVLGDHRNTIDPSDSSPLARLCVHTDSYGTLSSSVICFDRQGKVFYYHAPGAPCDTPFESVDCKAES